MNEQSNWPKVSDTFRDYAEICEMNQKANHILLREAIKETDKEIMREMNNGRD